MSFFLTIVTSDTGLDYEIKSYTTIGNISIYVYTYIPRAKSCMIYNSIATLKIRNKNKLQEKC